jgi:hypothetical protein
MSESLSATILDRGAGVPNREAGLGTRIIYWLVKRRRGRIHRGVRIRAHDARLLRLSFLMDRYTASSGTVPLALKELAQLKVAAMVGCPL